MTYRPATMPDSKWRLDANLPVRAASPSRRVQDAGSPMRRCNNLLARPAVFGTSRSLWPRWLIVGTGDEADTRQRVRDLARNPHQSAHVSMALSNFIVSHPITRHGRRNSSWNMQSSSTWFCARRFPATGSLNATGLATTIFSPTAERYFADKALLIHSSMSEGTAAIRQQEQAPIDREEGTQRIRRQGKLPNAQPVAE